MPSNCNTDYFSTSIEKHSWLRQFYNWFAASILLKNTIIKNEINICSKRNNKTHHVLYPGFGMGQLLGIFKNSKKFNVLALDKNPSLVAHSTSYFHDKNIKNIYCITNDVGEIEYKQAFDIGLMVNLLNYIEDDVKILKKVKDSLKSPGVLVLFNASDYADNKDAKWDTGIYKEQKYRNGYSIAEIKLKLKSAGFSKIKARYVYGDFGVLSWKISTGWPSYLIKASTLFYLILPFYILLFFPLVLILNVLEISLPIKKGKCIVVKAFN